MKKFQITPIKYLKYCTRLSDFRLLLFLTLSVTFSFNTRIASSQTGDSHLQYIISIPEPENHTYHLKLDISEWKYDTICLKMPNWMPGYYQMMEYAKGLENISARDENGAQIPVERINSNTWRISDIRNNTIVVTYTIITNRQFVANSYVDKDHAYLVPGNTFLYIDGFIQSPVIIKIETIPEWDIATGLDPATGKFNEFTASDFDILYDCPILTGKLDELPSFKVNGIEHRFIGYKPGDFDRQLFMDNLKKVVQAAVDIIGDVPYKKYTFIGIGPGRGGIEHLNNTTVSFNGKGLDSPNAMNGMMSFLAHEYFHHYNVKRIRPFELGPFDYDNGSRTNLLWISEGLTVYYESLILRRAGLTDAETMLSQLAGTINDFENDPGRFYQSLTQASYSTWEEGPFGTFGTGTDKSISVYTKGAIIGMLLDIEIRYASGNDKSLDDVMRRLYREYYIKAKRGFTDAEFQQECEHVAGISLSDLFEYVNTTKEIDYSKHLTKAGLRIDKQVNDSNEKAQRLMISRLAEPDSLQSAILRSWLRE